MAFPSGAGTVRTLDAALLALTTAAGNAKTLSAAVRSRAAAGTCNATELVSWLGAMASYRDTMTEMAAVPGLAAYAQEQYSNGGLNITTEYNTMVAAIDAARSWVATNFPKAVVTNELLERTFDGAGRVVPKVFTALDLAALLPLLDALTGSIN